MAEDRHPTLRALGLPDVRYFLTARFFGGTARTLFATAISWHLCAHSRKWFVFTTR